MEEGVSAVLLEITPGNLIGRIVIEQTDGSATEFRFSSPKEDINIADQQFRFSPPPGVETITGEFGQ
jgi:outer membrane lipoprotein-sorting protein